MSESLLIPHIHCERKLDFSCTTTVPLSRMYSKKDFGVKKTAVFVPFWYRNRVVVIGLYKNVWSHNIIFVFNYDAGMSFLGSFVV